MLSDVLYDAGAGLMALFVLSLVSTVISGLFVREKSIGEILERMWLLQRLMYIAGAFLIVAHILKSP